MLWALNNNHLSIYPGSLSPLTYIEGQRALGRAPVGAGESQGLAAGLRQAPDEGVVGDADADKAGAGVEERVELRAALAHHSDGARQQVLQHLSGGHNLAPPVRQTSGRERHQNMQEVENERLKKIYIWTRQNNVQLFRKFCLRQSERLKMNALKTKWTRQNNVQFFRKFCLRQSDERTNRSI